MGVAGRGKVLVKKGTCLHVVCQDTDREMAMMVECICSDGAVAPLLMILKELIIIMDGILRRLKG